MISEGISTADNILLEIFLIKLNGTVINIKYQYKYQGSNYNSSKCIYEDSFN